MKHLKPLLLEEIDSEDSGGGSGYGYEPVPAPKPAGQSAKPTTPPATTEAEGDGDSDTDEFGYKKVPEAKGKETVATITPKNQQEETKPDEKVENPVSGYDEKKEPEVAAPVVPEAPPAPSEDTTKELGYNIADLKFDGLAPAEKDATSKFIKDNKVSKEVAEAYVKMRQGEIAEFNKQQSIAKQNAERQSQLVRQQWHKELKDDPTFGGEKFGYNISRAEKVLDQFMTNTKKALTDKGGMLPPYVMRDLATMAKTLYSTESLVQGSPAMPLAEEGDSGLDEFGYAKV